MQKVSLAFFIAFFFGGKNFYSPRTKKKQEGAKTF